MKVATDDGKVTPVSTDGEMVLKHRRRAGLHLRPRLAAVQGEAIYPEITSVDWNYYYRTYHRFLPYINNNYDFAEMLSEMLGEVNASHTGCRLPERHSRTPTRPRHSGCSTTSPGPATA